MRTLFDERPRESGRPPGVTAVATIMLLYAFAAALYAILAARGSVALSSGAWVIGGGLEILGPFIFALYAAVRAIFAISLLRMHSWSRRASALLLLYELVQVTPAISSAVGDGRILAIAREGAQILWRSAAIWYLWQETTRDVFEDRRT
jgi:hypothetical protein